MASKLCCTVEEERHSDSPELPNARVTDVTPARRPLLPKQPGSVNSHFTSARSEDLHELRQIFDNAKTNEPPRVSPPKAINRARFNRPSVYSLHSLHKMKSMHSLIRQKFSRDLSKTSSSGQLRADHARKSDERSEPGTVVQQSKDTESPLHIAKAALKKDLFSDKRPEEGGYDSDAQVLDDIAKNIVKKTPSKRPSIHSIDWTPSTASKPTPKSSSKSDLASYRLEDVQPYQIKQPQSVSLSVRLSQVFSSPNLQIDIPKLEDRKLRRSHSAASIGLPEHSPLSPLRLPSLKTHDQDGVPWSVALKESLRLSEFPVPPLQLTPKQSRASLEMQTSSRMSHNRATNPRDAYPVRLSHGKDKAPPTPATVVQIRVQEPAAVSTPRGSGAVPGTIPNKVQPTSDDCAEENRDSNDSDGARKSVHLYSMRISHHLRSGSLLSWDNLADPPELPTPPHPFRDRSMSDLSRTSGVQYQQLPRHERKTSSSGFASSKVPSKWGKVITNDIREDMSSIYSSRPQSPPEEFAGSLVNLSRTPPHGASKKSSVDLTQPRRSSSYPTDNDDTPRPAQRNGINHFLDVSTLPRRSTETARLARNNSVASTKKSKFREEFSPSPPKKRLTPSASIMRFFTPKRSSQSEESLKRVDLASTVDGAREPQHAGSHRDHRRSKSIISLETEQKSLGNDKNASPMWDKALRKYQDERAAMFLPENKELAVSGSPFRERSVSVPQPQLSEELATPIKSQASKRLSVPLPGSLHAETAGPSSVLPSSERRAALASRDNLDVDPGQELRSCFEHNDTPEIVGAWGRYPSHTRPDRTASAGHQDQVDTRDFALEAAIKFAMGENETDDDNVDPITRRSTPLLSGRKRKKKLGHTHVAKSHSMTFGKTFLKNYTKLFRSQSIEFQKHGHGHRSSITTGGTLKYPELEILPDVWARGITSERNGKVVRSHEDYHSVQDEYGPGDRKGKGKMKADHSTSTPRPSGSTKTMIDDHFRGLDGQNDRAHVKDTARVWSAYYEDCLPSFPRASTDLDFNPAEFGVPSARRSLDSKRTSFSHTMPSRYPKHSRNHSHLSHFSVRSGASARPSFVSVSENEVGMDGRSVFSVRRSTMDLVTMYQELEDTEREKVLKLVRMDSSKERTAFTGL